MPQPIRVVISQPDRSFTVTTIKPELDVMQKIVGGFIEVVGDPSGDNGFSAYCNEEGKIHELPLNTVSTLFMNFLYTSSGLPRFSAHDVLVGPIIWCGGADDEGDDTSMPIDLINEFIIAGLSIAKVEAIQKNLVTVIREGAHVWTIDEDDKKSYRIIKDLFRAADTTPVEVWPHVTTAYVQGLTSRFEREDGTTVFH